MGWMTLKHARFYDLLKIKLDFMIHDHGLLTLSLFGNKDADYMVLLYTKWANKEKSQAHYNFGNPNKPIGMTKFKEILKLIHFTKKLNELLDT